MSAMPARPGVSASTSLLLTCAALGVAGGLLLAPANWLSTLLLTLGMPVVSVAITGLWILPSVIALRLDVRQLHRRDGTGHPHRRPSAGGRRRRAPLSHRQVVQVALSAVIRDGKRQVLRPERRESRAQRLPTI